MKHSPNDFYWSEEEKEVLSKNNFRWYAHLEMIDGNFYTPSFPYYGAVYAGKINISSSEPQWGVLIPDYILDKSNSSATFEEIAREDVGRQSPTIWYFSKTDSVEAALKLAKEIAGVVKEEVPNLE